jgi:hypothetical protein
VLEQLLWIYKRRHNALQQSRDSVDRPLRTGDGKGGGNALQGRNVAADSNLGVVNFGIKGELGSKDDERAFGRFCRLA